MAIGVAVTDFTTSISLNGVTIEGMCGDYVLLANNISGLGMPEAKVNDLTKADDHGTISGPDFAQSRLLSFPVAFHRDTAREAMVALRALKAAWRPAASDNVLSITIPGIGPSDDTLRFYGRPRSNLETDLHYLPGGIVNVLASFTALDPIGYGPTVVVTGTSAATVSNPGDAPSKRAIITITGNGGVPTLTNATDGGGNVLFSRILTNGLTWKIDLNRRDVVDGANDDAFTDNVLPASLWFRLLSGNNSLTLTGAASMSIEYRSGWW